MSTVPDHLRFTDEEFAALGAIADVALAKSAGVEIDDGLGPDLLIVPDVLVEALLPPFVRIDRPNARFALVLTLPLWEGSAA
jgi:hypothetical protein